ncbi:MAG: HPr family phosphocarrier protein [Ruminiclostridium sp.]|nr:HPr family phosphocarrier protein [Ruminiclostridium sp.]
MKKVKIMLVSIKDVKDFVNKANELSCEADLTLGKYVVDAKSIMGIFSLDLNRELELSVHSDSCEAFLNGIEKYIVK